MTPCGWQVNFPYYPTIAQTTLSLVKLYQSVRVTALVLHNSNVREMFYIYRPIIVNQINFQAFYVSVVIFYTNH